jgi:hypothetical protein
LIYNDFSGPYVNGYTEENVMVKKARPFFWDLSFSQIEFIVRRKIKRLLGLNVNLSN